MVEAENIHGISEPSEELLIEEIPANTCLAAEKPTA
jgi:hypothetical protein